MEHVRPGVFSLHHRAPLAPRTMSGFALSTPSPPVTPAHRMVFRSPTSSSPWAPRNLRALRRPRPLLCTSLSWCGDAVSFAFLSSVRVPSQRYKRRKRTEHPRWLLPEADQQQECGWSFPMLGALTHGVSAVKGTEEIRTKHNILSPSSPITPPPPTTMFRVQQENTQQPQLWSPPRLVSVCSPLLLLLLLALLPCSVLDRPPSVAPAGRRSCPRREDWLSDTATLTDPRHVTALLVEPLT